MFDSIRKKSESTAGSTFASTPDVESRSEAPVRSTSKMNSMTATVLSAETEFKGMLAFSGDLQLHGRLEGNIEADNGVLTIGETAVVKADIVAKDVVIYGKVQGNIKAEGKLELRGKAQLYGDVKANRFLVEDGSTFVGRSETISAKAEEADFNNIFNKLTSGKANGKPAL